MCSLDLKDSGAQTVHDQDGLTQQRSRDDYACHGPGLRSLNISVIYVDGGISSDLASATQLLQQ